MGTHLQKAQIIEPVDCLLPPVPTPCSVELQEERGREADLFIRFGQLRPCRDRHASGVHGHRRRRDRIRHDCARGGRIRARRDELGVEHHYVLVHRRERDADRPGRVFQSEVEGPVGHESSREVIEVPTGPFGPERKRCLDQCDRIAKLLKATDGPCSHGQTPVAGGGSVRMRTAGDEPLHSHRCSQASVSRAAAVPYACGPSAHTWANRSL